MARLGAVAHPDQRAYPTRHDERSRVLIETGDGALLISDFRFLVDASFDVAICAGPGTERSRCPLLRGEECELVTGADVVLHALDPDLHIAAAIKMAHPEVPVLVERPRPRDGREIPVPEGCVPLDMPSSLEGQLEAVRRAMASRFWSPFIHRHAGPFRGSTNSLPGDERRGRPGRPLGELEEGEA